MYTRKTLRRLLAYGMRFTYLVTFELVYFCAYVGVWLQFKMK